jgi:hypothetical protein
MVYIRQLHRNIHPKENRSDFLGKTTKTVSGKAKACCEVSNDRLGFLTALRILEKKYGGQNNMERALYEKLRNLGLLTTKDLNTVVEAKITIWSLVRLYTADNRDSNKLDEIVFTCMSLDHRAYADYRNFRVSKGFDNDTHITFTAWVETLERDDMRKRGQANISMGRTLDKTTAPVFTTTDSRSSSNVEENIDDISPGHKTNGVPQLRQTGSHHAKLLRIPRHGYRRQMGQSRSHPSLHLLPKKGTQKRNV